MGRGADNGVGTYMGVIIVAGGYIFKIREREREREIISLPPCPGKRDPPLEGGWR